MKRTTMAAESAPRQMVFASTSAGRRRITAGALIARPLATITRLTSEGRPELCSGISGLAFGVDEVHAIGQPGTLNTGVLAIIGAGRTNARPNPSLERPCRGDVALTTLASDCGTLLAPAPQRSYADSSSSWAPSHSQDMRPALAVSLADLDRVRPSPGDAADQLRRAALRSLRRISPNK